MSIGHPLRLPIRTDPTASWYMANMLLATPSRSVYNLLPPVLTSGTIREYTQVGDGVHLRPRQQLALLPSLERPRPRPHMLVRKVTVVGSHVLRHSSLASRRHQMRNFYRTRMSRFDQYNAYNYDQVDDEVDSSLSEDEPTMPNSGLLQIRPETHSVRLVLPPVDQDSSFLGIFDWKIYVGMLCIIAMQALIRLAYNEVFNMG